VLAATVSAALTVAGLVLFLVPGFVFMVLFAVVGPVIVIEGLGVRQGLRRSSSLTARHGVLVVVTVLIPTTLDEQLSSWLEHFSWYAHPWVQLPLDVGSTIIVGGLVGVLEVTLAHALILDQRRRRKEKAASAAAGPAAVASASPSERQDAER
jgi:hypothetical protein